MRVIGDVHGKFEQYIDIIKDVDTSVQVGDMGFSYNHMSGMNHIFIPGNHDNYDNLPQQALNGYGINLNLDVPFYYVRGGHSIDQCRRIEGISWWRNEELSYQELGEMIKDGSDSCMDLIISHEPPSIVSDLFDSNILKYYGYCKQWKSRTQHALQILCENVNPKIWIFGHMHKFMDESIDGTRFICLPELGYLDIDKELNITYPNNSRW